LTSATVLLSPYALDYDLMFLLLPWCLMIREAWEDPAITSRALVLWVSLTCLVPLTYLSQLDTHLAIGAPLLIAVLLMTYHESRTAVANRRREAV
jgi:hypothetical protein